jgi:hypothetical protein
LNFLQGEDQQGQFGDSRGSVSVGAGYLWANKVRVDYALVSNPDLGNTQRFSLGLVFGGSAPKPAPVDRDVASQVVHPVVADTVLPRETNLDSLHPIAPIDSIGHDSSSSAPSIPVVDSSAKVLLPVDSAAVKIPASHDTTTAASPASDSATPKVPSPLDSSVAPVPVRPPAPDTSGIVSVPQKPTPSPTPTVEPVRSPGNPVVEPAAAATYVPETPALAPLPKPRPSGPASVPADEWDAPEQQAP